MASKALETFGKLYDIEREIAAYSVKQKCKIRKKKSKPILDALHTFLKDTQPNLKFILEQKIDENDTDLIQKLMPWNPDLKKLIDKDFPPRPIKKDDKPRKK